MDDTSILPQRPFGSTADPDLFYPSRTHQNARAELGSAVGRHEGLAVLIGEPGTGKTTMLRRVAQDVESTGGRVLWWNVAVPLEEMAAWFLQQLGAVGTVPPDAPREALLGALKHHIQRGGAAVVAIDEAQYLGPADLGALRDLAAAGDGAAAPVTVLLAGHPELDATLAQLAGNEAGPTSVCRVVLSRLPGLEVGSYVAYRLAKTGAREVFPPDAIERVMAYAEGIPRTINHVCGAALHAARQAQTATVGATTVDAAARTLDLTCSDPAIRHAVPRSAPPRASARAKIGVWSFGTGVAACLVLATALLTLAVSQRPSPSSRPSGLAAAPQPPPTTPAPRTLRADVMPVTPAAPSAIPRPVVLPGPTGSPSPREPSVGFEARLPMPSRAAAPPVAPAVAPPRSVAAASLVDAAEAGNLSAVATLLAAGAPVDARDATDMTPLMVAIVHDHAQVVELLLARGAHVNARDDGGVTALMLAANNGRMRLLERLLDHGANVNAQTRTGWTALMYAAWTGRTDVAHRLLAAGANPTATDRTGWTALRYARWRVTDVMRAGGAGEPLALENPEPAEKVYRRYTELVDLLGGTRPR